MVSSDHAKTLLLGSVVPAALLALLLLAQWRSTACSFAEQPPGSGLLVCTQRLPLGEARRTEFVRVQRKEGWLWSRRQVDHWVLIDAGAPDSRLLGGYASSLVAAVQRKLGRPPRRGERPPQLDLIILTSARAAGALPALLHTYPEATVAAHSEEAPYLVGDPPLPLANITQPSLAAKLGLGLQAPQLGAGVPPHHFLALVGEGGDVADAALATKGHLKKALSWLPRGVLRFVRAGSPTPGSVAVIHSPSGAMLAGEAMVPSRGWLGSIHSLEVPAKTLPASVGTQKQKQRQQEQLHVAAKRLVNATGYSWLLPAAGGNFSRERALEMVADWPDEVAEAAEEEAARATAPTKEGAAGGGDHPAKQGLPDEEQGSHEEGEGAGGGGLKQVFKTVLKKAEEAVAEVSGGEGEAAAGDGGAQVGGVADTAAAGLGLSPAGRAPGQDGGSLSAAGGERAAGEL